MRCALVVLLIALSPVHDTAQTRAPADAHGPAPDSPVYAANEPARALKEGKVLHAFRITGTPPTIDGALDDQAWSEAEAAAGFIQRDPDNGEPMSEATRMQVAYDDRYLYVAIFCEDSAPADIAAGLGRRDEAPPTDTVSIGFDPRHDHLTAYIFRTNPSAIQADSFASDDDRIDTEYNAVWEVRVQMAPPAAPTCSSDSDRRPRWQSPRTPTSARWNRTRQCSI